MLWESGFVPNLWISFFACKVCLRLHQEFVSVPNIIFFSFLRSGNLLVEKRKKIHYPFDESCLQAPQMLWRLEIVFLVSVFWMKSQNEFSCLLKWKRDSGSILVTTSNGDEERILRFGNTQEENCFGEKIVEALWKCNCRWRLMEMTCGFF